MLRSTQARRAGHRLACKYCQRVGRYEVETADVRARVDAAVKLLEQSLGRAAQAEEPPVPRLPETVEAVRAMSWSDLCHVHSLQYADEIREVMRLGGPQALRQKLARLNEPERRVLREALVETPSS
jgi:hypothetical protein